MKIDPQYITHQINNAKATSHRPSSALMTKKEDPLQASLNQDFYQQLQNLNLNNAKDILHFLVQYEVKNRDNQTIKENRQRAILMYARQQSALEHTENQDEINQALVSFLSYQGFYHQITLELLGMTDNQDTYEGFFKPDSTSFSF
ncbi:hypothetical protein LW139_18530 [Proteus vulgaris]|uniref:hypothetical protein n=1 Tax=Proteus TaxID=583 RepID=UPI001411CCB3|nr:MULTISPECIES: hypothetical protein [Proteus]NBM54704.1 hypothetical protein [Proteus sp. G2669]UDN35691.1 hypothetical protein LG402_18515 [Proteus sp. NMG38-2]UPK80758.1 hypothetical protein LW139_18530 [Proteus vulgaris]